MPAVTITAALAGWAPVDIRTTTTVANANATPSFHRKKKGHGTYTYASGERYEGEMGGTKGYKHGPGKLYKADGSLKREGRWVEGEFQDE